MTEMFESRKMTLGFLPTRRGFFSREEAQKEKNRTLQTIRTLSPQTEFCDLEFLNEEGLLFDEIDAPRVVRRFSEAGVDALFAPHCNFGCEGAVANVARSLAKPLLLWAPRDGAPEPDGTRLRDSQCGVFATSKVLQRFGVKFSYIVSCNVDDPEFKQGFETFLGAANVLRHFKNCRIGQIGVRPRDFYSVICNENELLERFGISIIPYDTAAFFRDCRANADANSPELREMMAGLMNYADCSAAPEAVRMLTALYLTIRQWVKKEGLSAAAIQCWDAMQHELGICPCLINAVLADDNFSLACETDIHGAISSLLLQHSVLRPNPVFFADLTIRHPQDDNAELLWHCGPFPASLMRGKLKVGRHFVLPSHAPGVCGGELKQGHVSIARFDGISGEYSLFSGEGKIIDGPANQGTFGYMKVKSWPAWEKKIVFGPYVHHVAGAYCSASGVLREAASYIDGLRFDPAED